MADVDFMITDKRIESLMTVLTQFLDGVADDEVPLSFLGPDLRSSDLDLSPHKLPPSPDSPRHSSKYKGYITVNGDDGKEYICNQCGLTFKHRPDVIRHVKNVHSSKEACKFCFKMLKTAGRSDAKRKHCLLYTSPSPRD